MEKELQNHDARVDPEDDEQWRGTTHTEAPERSLAVFSATALQQDDLRTRFNIRLDRFKERTGFKFEEGRTYEIIGTIDGIADFRKLYSPGVSWEMAIFAPRGYAGSIRNGDKYTLHVKGIREISRNADQLGVFSSTAYKTPDRGDIRFDLLISSIEKRTGLKFDEERIYLIKGRISNICDFRVTHTGGKGEHLFVFAPREAADKLKAGEKYDLTFLSAEEKRTFQVPYTASRTRLTLQTRALRAAGLDVDGLKKMENRLVELEMRNLSQPDRGLQRFFIVLEPTRGVAVLNIERGGGKQGDVYELVRAKQPTIEEFVTDFNVHRGKELQNVLLGLDGKRLWMDVDGSQFELKNESLKVQNLQVFLSVKFGSFKRDLRFWFDGEIITPKFGQSWRIKSFARTEKGMSLRYMMGKSEITTRSGSGDFRVGRLERAQFLGKAGLLGDVRWVEGNCLIKINEDLFRKIYARITESGSKEMYNQERGSIGENIAVAVLIELGWKEVVAHPFAGQPGPEPYKPGTDSLMVNPENKLFLVEGRWHKDINSAAVSAFREVMQRRAKEQEHSKYGKIEGAYVAILNLKLTNNVGELYIKRVW